MVFNRKSLSSPLPRILAVVEIGTLDAPKCLYQIGIQSSQSC